MSGPLDELFARAREADIEAVAGVRLYRSGGRMRGECPICGASKGKRGSGAFSADVKAGIFKCWACDAGGDVVRLEQLLRGGSPREAAERLAGPARPTERPRPESRPALAPIAPPSRRLSGQIWLQARPAVEGPMVRRYLTGRGIHGEVLEGALAALRFHAAAPWEWDDAGGWICAPAMIAEVIAPSGPTGGVHCTYLSADGRSKASLDPAKKMWGPQTDAEGRPGAVWLGGPLAGPAIVAEGIESALSAALIHGRPCGIAATLSLGRLQGGWRVDRFGRMDPDMPRADPERPAFTWPGVDEVLIAVDRDMAPVEVKVRAPLGGTVRRRLDGDARARLCAGLAIQHWRLAGATRVSAIAPPAGLDFNDALRDAAG